MFNDGCHVLVYAEKKEMEESREALLFNCAQRMSFAVRSLSQR